MPKAALFAPGVEYDAGTGGDHYLGRPEALIAAGIITADKVPGAPGMPKSSVTFVDGVAQPRGQKPKHDERWMQATMVGRQLRVSKGISDEERDRRERKRAEEIAEMNRTRPMEDIGYDGAAKALRDASAIFKVGDSVIADGYPALVIGEYALRRVNDEKGQFLSPTGKRCEYRWGYACRYRSGEEFFFPAHQITTHEDGAPYLRLVAGARRAERPALALREAFR